jgi:hypothetical protein
MHEHGDALQRRLLGVACLEQTPDSDLSWSEVADDAAGAVTFLARCGDALRFLNRASVFYRFLLGRRLLSIQEHHLWSQMERPVGDEQNGTHAAYSSWADFMARGFPLMTGLSPKTGYGALTLAKSPALQKLAESELRKFENLGNAIQLEKLERKGVVVTPELIIAAQTLSIEAYRQMTGSGKKATVEVVVDSSEAARALQATNDILKMADTDALRTLHEVFQHAMLRAGGNATDAVDCVIAACWEQWQQEGLPEAASRDRSQEDHRSF